MMAAKEVEIVEVGPRDGLQNEAAEVSTADKISFISRALEAGLRRIEVASFVHPKIVPQMADAEAVVAGLPDNVQAVYIGLVLNMKGLRRALATREGGRGINEVGAVAVCSDTFAEKNQGQTRLESIEISNEIVTAAKAEGLSASVTISAAFGCPFEGEISAENVVEVAERLAEAGPDEIAIADTIGVGVPSRVTEIFASVREAVPHIPLRGHFHNTRNTGIANAWAAFDAG
ncbi:MAG: hydroxymethylglutaryl-CoA lyase, partial [Sphingomonadales bacterium]